VPHALDLKPCHTRWTRNHVTHSRLETTFLYSKPCSFTLLPYSHDYIHMKWPWPQPWSWHGFNSIHMKWMLSWPRPCPWFLCQNVGFVGGPWAQIQQIQAGNGGVLVARNGRLVQVCMYACI
jgi:hypothetical protein